MLPFSVPVGRVIPNLRVVVVHTDSTTGSVCVGDDSRGLCSCAIVEAPGATCGVLRVVPLSRIGIVRVQGTGVAGGYVLRV